jgi:hypothetical protein
MRSDHQVRLNTVMIPVTVAKIMVPMSGTKIAQDSQSAWFATARIRNSTETPTMRLARTSSILWPGVGDDGREDRRRAEGGGPEDLVDRNQSSCGQQPW